MMPIVMPMLMNAWTPNQTATPDATSMPNMSSATAAALIARKMMMPSSPTITAQPTKPSSSPATVKMKSVCTEGTKFPPVNVPWNRPWPNVPPEPTAIFACSAL